MNTISITGFFSELEKIGEIIPGGKAEGLSAANFPADQLRMGIKVEKEHTPRAALAEEIAKDHLEEFPNYYTGLAEMEAKLKAQKSGGEKEGEENEVPATGRVIPKEELVAFFQQPGINDEQVHELAEAHKMSPHDLETQIYGLLGHKLKESSAGGAAALGTELLGIPGGIIGGLHEGGARGAIGAGAGSVAGLGAGLGVKHMLHRHLTGGEFGRRHPLAATALEALPLAVGSTLGGAVGSQVFKRH